MNNRKLGYIYENEGVKYLKNLGYDIISQNFYSNYGEIDIIAIKGDILSAVEVKYRENPKLPILSSISKKKIDSIVKTLYYFLSKNPEYQNYNFRVDALLIEVFNMDKNIIFVENIQANY